MRLLRRPLLWVSLLLVLGLAGLVRPRFASGDAELAALGQARAAAVKQALIADDGLDPTRVFVSTADTLKAREAQVQMEPMVK